MKANWKVIYAWAFLKKDNIIEVCNFKSDNQVYIYPWTDTFEKSKSTIGCWRVKPTDK